MYNFLTYINSGQKTFFFRESTKAILFMLCLDTHLVYEVYEIYEVYEV